MSDSTEITTERLLLRPVTSADAADIFEYCQDPEVARFTLWQAHRTVSDAGGYVAFVLAHESDNPGSLRHVWAIRLRHHRQVVGTIDLIQRADDTAYTDFALARAFWNRGYMTEAVRAVSTWAFKVLPTLQQMRSSCLTENVGSRRVLEKAGFVLVSRDQVRLPEKFAFEQRELSRYELLRRPEATINAV